MRLAGLRLLSSSCWFCNRSALCSLLSGFHLLPDATLETTLPLSRLLWIMPGLAVLVAVINYSSFRPANRVERDVKEFDSLRTHPHQLCHSVDSCKGSNSDWFASSDLDRLLATVYRFSKIPKKWWFYCSDLTAQLPKCLSSNSVIAYCSLVSDAQSSCSTCSFVDAGPLLRLGLMWSSISTSRVCEFSCVVRYSVFLSFFSSGCCRSTRGLKCTQCFCSNLKLSESRYSPPSILWMPQQAYGGTNLWMAWGACSFPCLPLSSEFSESSSAKGMFHNSRARSELRSNQVYLKQAIAGYERVFYLPSYTWCARTFSLSNWINLNVSRS